MVDQGVRCVLMRGGTSKGAYLLRDDLPTDVTSRDELLLRIMGSPDARQIDGLGGAHPLTSKVAVVGPSDDADTDVDYLFLQVGVETPEVSEGQNCGNLLAGVGPFAVEAGLVAVRGQHARVRIRMRNTGSFAIARFPLQDGMPRYDGDTEISGVPGRAARVELEFADIAGSTCGSLVPTGRPCDVIAGVEVTCVDNGMPVVLMRARDVGITGYEACAELEADQALRRKLEEIRRQAGEAMGLGDVTDTTVPKMTMIAPPVAGGDVCTRTFIPHRCHDAIGVLGAVSVATGCRIPGSVGADLGVTDPNGLTVLEHPTGRFEATVRLASDAAGGIGVERAGIIRTTRKLMEGFAFPRPA